MTYRLTRYPHGKPNLLVPRVAAVLVVIMLSEMTFLAAEAESLSQQTIDIETRPVSVGGGFEYTEFQNRGSLDFKSNFQTWPQNDSGIYVGSYVQESKYTWRHPVEDPDKAFVVFDMRFRIDSAIIGSGASVTRIRLPFTIPDGAGWGVLATLDDETRVQTILQTTVIYPGLAGNMKNERVDDDVRTYWTLRTPLTSDTTYRLRFGITAMSLGDQITFYQTDDDVAGDGLLGGTMSVRDEYDGINDTVIYDTLADFGFSFLFIEGAPRSGYVGYLMSPSPDASIPVLFGQIDKLDLTNMNNKNGQTVMVHIPVYALNNEVASVSALVRIVCGPDLFFDTGLQAALFTQGLFLRIPDTDLSVTDASDCRLSLVIIPTDATGDDFIMTVSPAREAARIIETTGDFITYYNVNDEEVGTFARPAVTFTSYDKPVAPVVIFPPTAPAIVLAVSQIFTFASEEIFAPMVAMFQTANSAVLTCGAGVATTVFTDRPYGPQQAMTCARNLPVVGSVATAAIQTTEIIQDLATGTIDLVTKNILDPPATITEIRRASDEFVAAGFSGGFRILTLQTASRNDGGSGLMQSFIETVSAPFAGFFGKVIVAIQKVIFLIQQVLSILIYAMAALIFIVRIIAAAILVTALRMMLTGNTASIGPMIAGKLRLEDLEHMDRDDEMAFFTR